MKVARPNINAFRRWLAGLIDVCNSLLSAAPDFHVSVLRGHFATIEFF